MKELARVIEAVAKERSTVLLTGESGTGKELVARAIHSLSPRVDKPFVPVNCGAVAESLLESELFGFMKGTFTGAEQNRAGVFEAADGGTIFLDEIGEMPASMQVKMLRVLQDGKVRRTGAQLEIDVDTRVVAATNRSLSAMVDEGKFREDLFYRISVIPIHVPPLRERREDIPLLADHFVRKFSARSGKSVAFTSEALAVLAERPWKGNVRELEHTVERLVALTPEGDEISREACVAPGNGGRSLNLTIPDDGLDIKAFLETVERDLAWEAMRKSGGNQTRAAELLKMEVHQFRYLLKKYPA
jgi:transcriptional regulator with GAF, ATPase, and Fis domain